MLVSLRISHTGVIHEIALRAQLCTSLFGLRFTVYHVPYPAATAACRNTQYILSHGILRDDLGDDHCSVSGVLTFINAVTLCKNTQLLSHHFTVH